MSWYDTYPDEKKSGAENAIRGPLGLAAREYAGKDAETGFLVYLTLADRRSRATHGVSILEIGDWTWRDAYDDEVTPAEALSAAIEADGMFA